MSHRDTDARRTVLVVGATGRTGRHVVDGLLTAGVAVRALVRHSLTADLPAGVTTIEGTLQDPGAVLEAAAGADAAFLLWIGGDPAEIGPVVDALTSEVGARRLSVGRRPGRRAGRPQRGAVGNLGRRRAGARGVLEHPDLPAQRRVRRQHPRVG